MTEPKPYDFVYDTIKQTEMKRWFREMEGYLKASDFLNDSTDREGRKYAMNGFYLLRYLLGADPNKQECKVNSPTKETSKDPILKKKKED